MPSTSDAEEWRPVAGWEGLYEVSSLGRVRSLDRIVRRRSRSGLEYDTRVVGRLLRQCKANYFKTNLGRGQKVYVHHLVCAAFRGPRPPDHQAAHLDGDTYNNRSDNLAWTTVAENCSHKFEHGTQPLRELHHGHKLTSEQVHAIREARGKVLQRELAARFGIAQTTVGKIQRRAKRKYD